MKKSTTLFHGKNIDGGCETFWKATFHGSKRSVQRVGALSIELASLALSLCIEHYSQSIAIPF